VDDRIRTQSEFGTDIGHLPSEPAAIAIAPWHGIEHSLASVVLGAVFALGGPSTALLIEFLQNAHFQGIDRVGVGVLGVAGSLGGLFVVTASVFGLVFGIMGMLAARRQHRPIALGLAGVFLNGLNVLMWLGLLLCWILAVLGHH
jgi:hypothetical protein